jgi:hypothetical protein
VLKVQGRVADPHDSDFEVERISVVPGSVEGEIESDGRHTDALLDDHAWPFGTDALEKFLQDADEKVEI